MTRIIGGRAGGRRLETPKGQATRPTSDRVREALFSAIEAWCGSLAGLRFLDLYAGSGAVGLEAISRGAGVATLVEQDRRTASLIQQNARTLGFTVDVRASSVSAVLARYPTAPYDVVFLDPPYPLPDADVEANLAALVSGGWLAADALVVVERSSRGRTQVEWPEGIEALRDKKYGETLLRYGHAAPSGDDDAAGGDEE